MCVGLPCSSQSFVLSSSPAGLNIVQIQLGSSWAEWMSCRNHYTLFFGDVFLIYVEIISTVSAMAFKTCYPEAEFQIVYISLTLL